MIIFFLLNIGLLIYIWWRSFTSKIWIRGIHLQVLAFLYPFLFGLVVLAVFTNIFPIEFIKIYKKYIYAYSSINLLLLIPQWYKLAWLQLQRAQKKTWADSSKLYFVVVYAVLMVFAMVFLFALYYLWINSIGGANHGLVATFDYQPITMRFDDALYFSFVTYFTLGYGDLIPSGFWMRIFVFMECLASVLNTGIIAVYTYNFLFHDGRKTIEYQGDKDYKKV
ncbi:MAG: ion channel [Bacillota bacterium]